MFLALEGRRFWRPANAHRGTGFPSMLVLGVGVPGWLLVLALREGSSRVKFFRSRTRIFSPSQRALGTSDRDRKRA